MNQSPSLNREGEPPGEPRIPERPARQESRPPGDPPSRGRPRAAQRGHAVPIGDETGPSPADPVTADGSPLDAELQGLLPVIEMLDRVGRG